MVKRGTLEIYVDVLGSVKRHSKPTKIMYKTNLSWTPLQTIFGELEKKELIRIEHKITGKREYFLTSKGRKALDFFKSQNDLFGLKHLKSLRWKP